MNPREHQHPTASLHGLPGPRAVLVAMQGVRRRQVLQRAAQLPLAPGARITVLQCAARTRSARGESTGCTDSLDALEAHARAVGGRLSLFEAEAGEDVLGTVMRHREQQGAELVMLAREPRSLRTRLFGAFPERLARHSDVPVLVVELAAKRPYQYVLAGTDFSGTSRAALELALRMTAPGTGRMDVLHAFDTGYALTLHMANAPAEQLVDYYHQRLAEAEGAMRAFLEPYRGAPVDLRPVLTREEPRQALHRAASKQGVELLVVGKHRDTGMGHALLGSVAEACLRRSCYDVLVVPDTPVH